MRITGLEIIEVAASDRGNWIFVRLHTDGGISGLGEASQSGNDELVCSALKQLDQRLQGEDPTQVEVLWEKMVRATNIFSGRMGRVEATAISAVDQALWDIAGKALGVPIWRLLGGAKRQRVRLYANLNRGTQDRSPAGFAAAAAAAVQAGFKAIKCTPFDEVQAAGQDRDGMAADVEKGVERIRATRQAIGAEIELLVDCHCRFDLALANQVSEMVKPYNLYWYEEPVGREQLDALGELRRDSGQRVAAGEELFGREGFWPLIAHRQVDVIMPDVKHAGGITECRRIAALAETRQIAVAPHSPAGPVSTMAGVHLAATIANFLVLEFAFGEVEWRARLVEPVEIVQDGYIVVPQQPGLGLELDEATLALHRA